MDAQARQKSALLKTTNTDALKSPVPMLARMHGSASSTALAAIARRGVGFQLVRASQLRDGVGTDRGSASGTDAIAAPAVRPANDGRAANETGSIAETAIPLHSTSSSLAAHALKSPMPQVVHEKYLQLATSVRHPATASFAASAPTTGQKFISVSLPTATTPSTSSAASHNHKSIGAHLNSSPSAKVSRTPTPVSHDEDNLGSSRSSDILGEYQSPFFDRQGKSLLDTSDGKPPPAFRIAAPVEVETGEWLSSSRSADLGALTREEQSEQILSDTEQDKGQHTAAVGGSRNQQRSFGDISRDTDKVVRSDANVNTQIVMQPVPTKLNSPQITADFGLSEHAPDSNDNTVADVLHKRGLPRVLKGRRAVVDEDDEDDTAYPNLPLQKARRASSEPEPKRQRTAREGRAKDTAKSKSMIAQPSPDMITPRKEKPVKHRQGHASADTKRPTVTSNSQSRLLTRTSSGRRVYPPAEYWRNERPPRSETSIKYIWGTGQVIDLAREDA